MRFIISAALPVLLAQCAPAAQVEQSGTCRRLENKALRVTVDAAGVWVDWNDLVPVDDGRIINRHNGQLNALWCDGHVKSMGKDPLRKQSPWTPEED